MASNLDRLLEVMRRLRDPEAGCPWDREQSFASIAPYTLEEAHEVADAIERGDLPALREELGDLLFQVVFHAQMAREAGAFSFDDVAGAAVDKMVRRHPHVFGDERLADADAQREAWEAHKARERGGERGAAGSVLDAVARGLPAFRRGLKLQQRAARHGFDWPGPRGVLDKLEEETRELEEAVEAGADGGRLAAELGDLLFTCVNLARHLDLEPEAALRGANARFERRFRRMEALLAERGEPLERAEPGTLERLWEQAKSEGL